jgi:predicted aconitase
VRLTAEERAMLGGAAGRAVKKSMEILCALGEIYGARRLVEVSSVQIAGVSYDNLGEAGLEFLEEMAQDGRVRVLTTLTPAGLDVENPAALGSDEGFAARQRAVLETFRRMGVVPTCTCTPYLVGNLPLFGQHLAWSESSAVCFANSVLGARTNREGGPSALAAALTGRTPEHGLHLDEARRPEVCVEVRAPVREESRLGALGALLGERLGPRVAYVRGCGRLGIDALKSLCAALATFGGAAMFHLVGVTPEPASPGAERLVVEPADLEAAAAALDDRPEVDLVSVGCPHLSLEELRRVAVALEGRRVQMETWVHLARPLRQIADRLGYSRVIEAAGARLACDTCMVVAPVKGRFRGLATSSAKCVYYARARHGLPAVLRSLEECLGIACGDETGPRAGERS